MNKLNKIQDMYTKLIQIEGSIKSSFGDSFFTHIINNEFNLLLQTEDFIITYCHDSDKFKLSFTADRSPKIVAFNMMIILEYINALDLDVRDENYYDKEQNKFVYGQEAYDVMDRTLLNSQGVKRCNICNITFLKECITADGYCLDCNELKHNITWN